MKGIRKDADIGYAKGLYSIASTKDKMICKRCGKEIILCDRCGGSGFGIITECIGKGFVHKDKGHFHHCNTNTNTFRELGNLGEVAFPILTEDEAERLKHYTGVKHE
jgi:hypothetical protein